MTKGKTKKDLKTPLLSTGRYKLAHTFDGSVHTMNLTIEGKMCFRKPVYVSCTWCADEMHFYHPVKSIFNNENDDMWGWRMRQSWLLTSLYRLSSIFLPYCVATS